MIPVEVGIVFTSDWGIGTGRGLHGSLDRVICTDDLGLPMVPAKTLTGMLRDSAEQVTYALNQGRVAGPWTPWLEWLFGTQPAQRDDAPLAHPKPRPAALSVRPALLPETMRRAVARAPQRPTRGALSQRELVAATRVVRPGVQINPTTGVAADDTLRLEEWAVGGLSLVTVAQLDCEEAPDEAVFLLHAAARNLRRIGGKRRRGLGRCQVSINLADSTYQDALAKVDLDTPAPVPDAGRRSATSTTPGHPRDVPEGPLPKVGDLDITCLTPVCVPEAVVGNTVRGADYIPGTDLLAIVAAAIGPEAAGLIRESRIAVGNAYPVIEDTVALPLPRALQGVKDFESGSDLHNGLHGYLPRRYSLGGYLADTGSGFVHGTVAMVLSAHAVVSDHEQRPTEAGGGLFVMQAMAPGTRLRAEVFGDIPTAALVKLSGLFRVGRAKKDDYGQVRMTCTPTPRFQSTPHLETPTSAQGEGLFGTEVLRVWLTSDALLTTRGRPDPSPDALGRQLAILLGLPGALVPARAEFVSWRRTDSWSSRWSLPRPSLVALAAGSVLDFHQPPGMSSADPQPTADNTRPGPDPAGGSLVAVGERTAEGFGQFVINPVVLSAGSVPTRPARVLTTTDAQALAATEPPPLPTLMSTLTRLAWRRRIDAATVSTADGTALDRVLARTVTRAQLGVLRSLVLDLADDPDLGRAQVDNWLNSLSIRPDRAAPWTTPPVPGAQPLRVWLGSDNDRDLSAALADVLQLPQSALTDQGLVGYARTRLLLNAIQARTRASQLEERDGAAPTQAGSARSSAELVTEGEVR